MLASSSVLTSLQLCLRHTCAVNRPHVCRRREFKKWVWEAKTSGGVWDAEAFVRMLIFHLQTEARETQTWKFNVFRLSVLSELPLPVGYWSPFPCLLLALLCSPATARVLEQDLFITHEHRRANALHPNLEIRGKRSPSGGSPLCPGSSVKSLRWDRKCCLIWGNPEGGVVLSLSFFWFIGLKIRNLSRSKYASALVCITP